MVQFEYPKFKYGVNPPAVYRMDFDTGHFYIGSSKRVKTRMVLWRTNIKRNDFSNRVMVSVLPFVKKISFSIIERCANVDMLLENETKWIAKYFDNPLCLNRCPTAFNNSNIKPLPENLRKPRKKPIIKPRMLKGKFIPPKDYVWSQSKKINKYAINGEFIEQFKSIGEAAKSACVDRSVITDHVKVTKVFGIGGFVFRKADGSQLFEILKKTEKKLPIIKYSGKPIIDLNAGVYYYSIQELSKYSEYAVKTLYNKLGGFSHNNTQYRYA